MAGGGKSGDELWEFYRQEIRSAGFAWGYPLPMDGKTQEELELAGYVATYGTQNDKALIEIARKLHQNHE